MLQIENYIGGELVSPASGEYLDNFAPATGEVYSLIPDSDDRDVNLAAEAATLAFPAWSATPPEERFSILMRLVSLIEREAEPLRPRGNRFLHAACDVSRSHGASLRQRPLGW